MNRSVRVTSKDTTERQRLLDNAERITEVMDEAFTLPVIGIRVGWDTIIGLIPGAGDLLAAIPGLYHVYAGMRLDVPDHVLIRMVINLSVDLILGSVPLIGDVFDVVWKANAMNLKLLERYA